jgi:hypothetical protein
MADKCFRCKFPTDNGRRLCLDCEIICNPLTRDVMVELRSLRQRLTNLETQVVRLAKAPFER